MAIDAVAGAALLEAARGMAVPGQQYTALECAGAFDPLRRLLRGDQAALAAGWQGACYHAASMQDATTLAEQLRMSCSAVELLHECRRALTSPRFSAEGVLSGTSVLAEARLRELSAAATRRVAEIGRDPDASAQAYAERPVLQAFTVRAARALGREAAALGRR